MTTTSSFSWIGSNEIEIATRHDVSYIDYKFIHMRVKAEDEQIRHLHIESQDVSNCIQVTTSPSSFALATSIELAENKSKRFHQFLPNVQP